MEKSETKNKSNIKSKIKKQKKHFANHLEQRITRRNNAVEEKKNLFIQYKTKRIYIVYTETDRETDGQLSMLNNIVPRNKVNSSQTYRTFTI